jgi:uncharacterized protein YcfJ
MSKLGLGKWFLAAAAVGVGSAALADPYYGQGYGYYPPPGPAPGQAYAEVLSSQPVYRQVAIAVPQQQCYQQPVTYVDNRPSIGGTLLGGLAGGLIGHTIGRGSGNAWATGIGAVVGAGVGNNIASAGEVQRTAYQQQCTMVSNYQYQQQLEGYNVTYRYGGQVYSTHLPYDPGPQLLVNVNVAPAPGY